MCAPSEPASRVVDRTTELPCRNGFLLLSARFWSSCRGSSVVRSTTRDAGGPGSNPALGKQWSRDYPIDVLATPKLTDTNRYQEAPSLDWRKWTKEGCSFLLLFAQFWSSCHGPSGRAGRPHGTLPLWNAKLYARKPLCPLELNLIRKAPRGVAMPLRLP